MTGELFENDRAWFAAHPGRKLRIRRMISDEFFPDPNDPPKPKKGQSLAEAMLESAALVAEAKSNFPVVQRGQTHFTLVQKLSDGVRARSHLILGDQFEPEVASDDVVRAIASLQGAILLL
ncbi:hypothetical protein [Thalassovita mangrovi]|uniref:Uncharacterized protein n=1 Tax=Thalassovita mangrovi TaxID=2692236 RepID=A0A6L8LCG9_9RHOB|nr:hypothetical protein [Thalassovita mangrovi]MYM53757.1 hypothetical protein [Thalassovita mangrovi]